MGAVLGEVTDASATPAAAVVGRRPRGQLTWVKELVSSAVLQVKQTHVQFQNIRKRPTILLIHRHFRSLNKGNGELFCGQEQQRE